VAATGRGAAVLVHVRCGDGATGTTPAGSSGGTEFALRRPTDPSRFCSRACANRAGASTQRSVKGENHHMWKGERASRSAVHHWMLRHFPKAVCASS
jgi:hypothetical protein